MNLTKYLILGHLFSPCNSNPSKLHATLSKIQFQTEYKKGPKPPSEYHKLFSPLQKYNIKNSNPFLWDHSKLQIHHEIGKSRFSKFSKNS